MNREDEQGKIEARFSTPFEEKQTLASVSQERRDGFVKNRVLFVVALLVFLVNAVDFILLNSASGWPETTGVIDRVGLKAFDKKDAKRQSEQFSTRVYYRYAVNGATFQGHRLLFSLFSNTENDPNYEQCIKRYPVGSTVLVHYRPNDPMDSFLMVNWSELISVVCFSLGTLFLFIASMRIIKRN